MIPSTPTAFLPDLGEEEYHKDEAIGSTSLKEAERSLLHYRHQKEVGFEPTAAMVVGSALHTMALEPEHFEERFHVFTMEGPKNRNPVAAAWKAHKAEAADTGRAVLDLAQMELLNGMMQQLEQAPALQYLRDHMRYTEASIFWTDPATGLRLKCRPDMIAAGLVGDLKKTQDAREHACRNKIVQHGYHVQAALYLRGMRAVIEAGLLEDPPDTDKLDFVFAFVEEAPPHGVRFARLDRNDVEYADSLVTVLLAKVSEAYEKNEWPGYPDTIETINLPNWVTGGSNDNE